MATTTIATEFVRSVREGFNGDARLYKLSSPIEFKKYNFDTKSTDVFKADHIIVSSVSNAWAHETMAFPADENGAILDWGSLACGDYGDHEGVLREALTSSLEDKQ